MIPDWTALAAEAPSRKPKEHDGASRGSGNGQLINLIVPWPVGSGFSDQRSGLPPGPFVHPVAHSSSFRGTADLHCVGREWSVDSSQRDGACPFPVSGIDPESILNASRFCDARYTHARFG